MDRIASAAASLPILALPLWSRATATSCSSAPWSFADVNGLFWPRKSTWARRASIHEETVKRAVREAEAAGLITREAHARPNGRQGSNTYRFDAELVAAASSDAGFGQW